MSYKMFDLNKDGELDAAERALEYMTFRFVTSASEDTDDLDLENTDCRR